MCGKRIKKLKKQESVFISQRNVTMEATGNIGR